MTDQDEFSKNSLSNNQNQSKEVENGAEDKFYSGIRLKN
jgi:hypothetical protein